MEFFVEEGIDDKEAVSLLELEPVKKDKDKFRETQSASESVSVCAQHHISELNGTELKTNCM